MKPEFPALTLSKIRYLEKEGLLTPKRTAAGYRQYSDADVQRLRYILTLQRDSYCPLEVIGDHLAALDAGHEDELEPTVKVVSEAGKTKVPVGSSVSVRQLCDLTGITREEVESYVKLGILTPDLAGYFPVRAIQIVQLVAQINKLGIPTRMLRTLRNSAERQADLIDQTVDPMRARGRSGDVERAHAKAQQLTEQCANLHREFLRGAVDRLMESGR
ncbi:MAG: MerR family transcriptional regulator [Actinomycetaceae bacterium]|nr:MerR family transcriptional regulator [Actinomycetaceae bacterium]